MRPLRVASLLALVLVIGGLLVSYLFDNHRSGDDAERPSLQPGDAKELQPAVSSTRPLLSHNSAIPETGAATDQSESLPDSSPAERLFDCSFEDLQESNERRGKVPRFYFTGNDEQITEALRRVSDSLGISADPELLALAAYLQMRLSDSGQSEVVDRALSIDSEDPLVAWTWLAICEHSNAKRCVDGTVLKHAMSVDGGNGVLLERMASGAFRDGQSERAFAILDHALAAPRFDTYFAEQVSMFDRALAAAGISNYQERFAAAFGYAAAMGRSSDTYSACTVDTLPRAYWHTCAQYGLRLESDGDNVLDQMIGLSMQENVYRLQDDQHQIQNVVERKEEIRASLDQTSSSDVRLVMNTDETVMRQYMEHLTTYGELAAMQFVNDEVQRLAQDPAYDPCATIDRQDLGER